MQQIGFDKRFTLLTQESHLAKNTLLSGFDLLLKANFYQERDGYFYAAFFHLAIGLERILKLAVVTDYMIANHYKTPTVAQLKKDYGHDIRKLYEVCVKLLPVYTNLGPETHSETGPASAPEPVPLPESDTALLNFFAEYGKDTRYFNLNEVCDDQMRRSPLYQWLDLVRAIYKEYTPHKLRENSASSLIQRMDKHGPVNGYTNNLDEQGLPLTAFDCLHTQLVIQKSSPLAIWRLIEILRPFYFLLEGMAHKASQFENSHGSALMIIPHYEEFFPFLLSDRTTCTRRKQWLDVFNG